MTYCCFNRHSSLLMSEDDEEGKTFPTFKHETNRNVCFSSCFHHLNPDWSSFIVLSSSSAVINWQQLVISAPCCLFPSGNKLKFELYLNENVTNVSTYSANLPPSSPPSLILHPHSNIIQASIHFSSPPSSPHHLFLYCSFHHLFLAFFLMSSFLHPFILPSPLIHIIISSFFSSVPYFSSSPSIRLLFSSSILSFLPFHPPSLYVSVHLSSFPSLQARFCLLSSSLMSHFHLIPSSTHFIFVFFSHLHPFIRFSHSAHIPSVCVKQTPQRKSAV